MPKISTASARHFLDNLELPPVAKGGYEAVDETPRIDFDALKNQAVLVGSDVVSFVKGVSAQRRQDIVNSALLAQLVANNTVKDRNNVFEWY